MFCEACGTTLEVSALSYKVTTQEIECENGHLNRRSWNGPERPGWKPNTGQPYGWTPWRFLAHDPSESYEGYFPAAKQAAAEMAERNAKRAAERAALYEEEYFRELEDSGRIPIITIHADEELGHA